MGYEIYAEPNKILTTASKHRELIKSMEGQRDVLKERHGILSRSWEGDASVTFLAEFTRQIEFLEDNLTTLKQIAGFEEKAANCYIETEKKIRGIIEAL